VRVLVTPTLRDLLRVESELLRVESELLRVESELLRA